LGFNDAQGEVINRFWIVNVKLLLEANSNFKIQIKGDATLVFNT
jgi:hypothetical protein